MNTWAIHAYNQDGSMLDDVPFGQREDYGVPTGVVPHFVRAVHRPDGGVTAEGSDDPTFGPMKGLDRFIYNPPLRRNAAARAAVLGAYAGPIQQAVDDYLLMERKAKAWDKLREHAKHMDLTDLLIRMEST
jgi:hypothetical protein